jgi:hypothetical protein
MDTQTEGVPQPPIGKGGGPNQQDADDYCKAVSLKAANGVGRALRFRHWANTKKMSDGLRKQGSAASNVQKNSVKS